PGSPLQARARRNVRRPAAPMGSSLRRLRRLMGDADRAAHGGAAEAAIAHRVLRQILLVVVLGKIELRRVEDFGGDRIEAPCLELLVVYRFRRVRGATLLGRERVDAGTVLRARVVALAHALGR